MKSYIFLLLLLIGATVCRGQSNDDSVVYRLLARVEIDSITNNFPYPNTHITIDSSVYEYNGNTGDARGNKASVETKYDFNDSNKIYVLYELIKQTFNKNDDIDTTTYMTFDTHVKRFYNSRRYVANYDADNNDTSLADQEWDSSTEGLQWKTVNKQLSTYDSKHNMLITEFMGLMDSTTLQLVYKTTYTYDINNRILTRIHVNKYTDSPFPDLITYYSYYKADSDSVIISVKLKPGGIQSDTISKRYTIYGKNNLDSVQLVQKADTIIHQWTNYQRLINYYDDKRNVINKREQVWIDTNWVDYIIITNQYNDAGLLLAAYQINKTFGNSQVTHKKYNYYYQAYHQKKKKSK